MKNSKLWNLIFLFTIAMGIVACSGDGTEDVKPNPDPTPKPVEARSNPNVSLSSEAAPASFSTKVLVEDYTGAWCGYCPRVAHALEEAVKTNANIIGMGIHQGDGMETSYAENLLKFFNIGGFPTAIINRSTTWDESYLSLDSYLKKDSDLGIALSTNIDKNMVTGTIKIGFAKDISKSIDYVVLLVEDKVKTDQQNYYNKDSSSPLYNLGNPIKDFEHANVLRKTATDIYGDIIPETYTKAGKVCQADFEINLANYNVDNCYILAFVIEKGGRKAMNTQIVKIGSSQDFD